MLFIRRRIVGWMSERLGGHCWFGDPRGFRIFLNEGERDDEKKGVEY